MQYLGKNTTNTFVTVMTKYFFILLLAELFLMGSGRYFEIGPVTLRMILYIIAVSMAILLYLHIHRINKDTLIFVYSFMFLIFFSSLIGLLNGAPMSKILLDIKPLLYFLMILPFSLFLKDKKSIFLTSKLIMYSSLLMATIYILWLVLMFLGYLDFKAMYALLSSESNEIMFRGGSSLEPGLFYKGFLYMCIGFIFFIYKHGKKNKIIATFIFIAIVLTFTRGFIVALILAFIFKSIVDIKKKKSFVFLIIIAAFLAIAIPYYMINVGLKPESDTIRITQFVQVIENINFMSFFIGHGFGIGVPIRPDSMEISYLEIFHKQGILGLLFWFSMLYYMVINYINMKDKNSIVQSLFVGASFVFMQSLTNPFMNNPIGLSMILISLISLEYIRNNEKVINA